MNGISVPKSPNAPAHSMRSKRLRAGAVAGAVSCRLSRSGGFSKFFDSDMDSWRSSQGGRLLAGGSNQAAGLRQHEFSFSFVLHPSVSFRFTRTSRQFRNNPTNPKNRN